MSPALKKALAVCGFVTPTPIQSRTIPAGLAGRDILGCAQTGTGKTLAFLIPIFERLLNDPSARALVLVPTRELGAQVHEVFEKLRTILKTDRSVLLIGGVSMHKQHRALSEPSRVLVATPGRLIDHLKHGSVSLRAVKALVLDEADRMLDIGFAPQLKEILRFLPPQRQTMMFTATIAGPIKDLADHYLKSPERVSIGTTNAPKASIERKVMEIEHKAKNETLLDVMKDRRETTLVFARTQSRADRLFKYMESYGFKVARIHGGRSQGQRTRALDGFRSGEVQILVATDIAARGLDIDHVGFVVNYDLPQAPEDYIHRIGRTGRAGRTGEALSFVTPEDQGTWRAILRLTGEAPPRKSFQARPPKLENHRSRR